MRRRRWRRLKLLQPILCAVFREEALPSLTGCCQAGVRFESWKAIDEGLLETLMHGGVPAELSGASQRQRGMCSRPTRLCLQTEFLLPHFSRVPTYRSHHEVWRSARAPRRRARCAAAPPALGLPLCMHNLAPPIPTPRVLGPLLAGAEATFGWHAGAGPATGGFRAPAAEAARSADVYSSLGSNLGSSSLTSAYYKKLAALLRKCAICVCVHMTWPN